MTGFRSALFVGHVVHKRLSPRAHGFCYRVFALCLDVDEIDALADQLRTFSRNRRNLVSFYDRDLGDGSATPVANKARDLLANAGLDRFGSRIELVCYPRLLGYAFNPLSVYFCRDATGTIGAIIYEVSNTFGERKSYIIETGAHDRTIESASPLAHTCRKELYVSPYTGSDGSYSFHMIPPAERTVIGVAFREGGRPVLKTHFSALRRPLSDRDLLAAVARHPLMTFKVIGAIHFEAARLWLKGVPLVERHHSAAYSSTVIRMSGDGSKYA